MSPPPHHPGSYLVVELTNRCSLACAHCAVADPGSQSDGHHARSGYLDPGLFAGLLDDLVRVGARFDNLVLFWLGEPLLHPHFGALWRRALRVAVRHGTFGHLEVHTNATHLTEGAARAALNDAVVPQTWAFTLDAAERETYRAVKGRDRLGQVERQVRRFLAVKAAWGARRPRVVLQFVVGSRNVGEAPAFAERWTGACRALGLPARVAAGHVPPGEDTVIFFRQLDCPTPAEQERENAVFRRAMAEIGLGLPAAARRGLLVEADNREPCAAFWKSPTVGWDGQVTTCTRDARLANGLGSLAGASFSELWWGPRMAARRMRVAAADYRDLPLCRDCFVPRSLNHGAITAREIAAEAAWQGGGHGPA